MNKNINKRLIGRTLFYGVLTFFVMIFIFGHHGVGTLLSLKHSNHQLQTTIETLKIKNKQLENEIAGWERYPFYKEQLAREQLQLSYSGDIIYYLV